MAVVYLSVGSNQGSRKDNIRKALSELCGFCEIEKLSGFYRTKPYGPVRQPDFINFAARIRTELSPQDLLSRLRRIERLLRRKRLIHWGPRTIDLDILFYDSEIIHTEDLEIPHPDMRNRRFVLEPLADICPDFIHPVLGKSVLQLMKELEARA